MTDENILDLTKKIISFPSLSLEEMELMKFIESLLKKNGIKYVLDEYVYKDKNTANIYVEVGNGDMRSEEVLVLYSHCDVVNAKEEQFSPKVIDDKLYGRGTVDMKSALSSMLYVVLNDYKKLNLLDKKIIFVFIADEESSGSGIKRFMDWCRKENIVKFLAILFEPSDNFSKMDIGGRGYCFLDLYGNMSSIIESFKKILENKEKLLNKFPDNNDGFGGCSIELTKVDCLLNDSHFEDNSFKFVKGKSAHASRSYLGENALENCVKTKKVSFLKTLNSESSNTIPSKVFYLESEDENSKLLSQINYVRGCIDIRTNLAGSKQDLLINEIIGLIPLDIDISIRDYGKAFISNNNRLRNILQQSYSKVFGADKLVEEVIAQAGSDATYLLGITSNIIAGFGPGLKDLCHTDNEYIDLDVLYKSPDLIREIINNFVEMKESCEKL